jgi:hypothetical protein
VISEQKCGYSDELYTSMMATVVKGNAADGNADYRRGVGANSAFEAMTDWNTPQGQYRLNSFLGKKRRHTVGILLSVDRSTAPL